MNDIKYIYQHAGKCDDQQNLKDIIGAAMVSTIEVITDDSPSFLKIPTTVKKQNSRKSLCLFTNTFDVRNKTSKLRVGDAKSKLRAIKVGNSLWTNKKNKKSINKSTIR